jgi:glycogen operon protein
MLSHGEVAWIYAMSNPQPRIEAGAPSPLGATWDGGGVNFALFSANAERVELCLFDPTGKRELRLALPERTDEVFHGYVPDTGPGQLYGYRVYGPYQPILGHRFNHHKLLLDPYAKALIGGFRWNEAMFGYQLGHPEGDLSFDARDSAPYIPKCQVVHDGFVWDGDRPPHRPWRQSVIYEMHVRGFSMRHPGVAPDLRGTFAGLATPALVRHLQNLGITAVELMPVHGVLDEWRLFKQGLRNFWGYNSLAFFAPEPRYLATGRIDEFKATVAALHKAGIEAILDVVYNHTGEGDQLGPTVCFRGIDNASYYRLRTDQRRYQDFTGCGNTFNVRHPRVVQLVLDSMRYWVEVMHVDGFRMDLASALARRRNGEFDPHTALLTAMRQDPVLSRVKLIAEPWDAERDGYHLGGFPAGIAEWNDRYRDTARRFWRGDAGTVAELATRTTGSADIFGGRGRRPWASINFVTCHDGFTLEDLVSYDHKHNEANGEHNRDGANENLSWNCGVEGPTDAEDVLALRARQKQNMLALLMLSQGTPMLLAGDEIGRTQDGNNNAYCQDNELGYVDWTLLETPEGAALSRFLANLIALRREHRVFRRERFFRDIPGRPAVLKDIVWLRPDGEQMRADDWRFPSAACLAFLLSGAPDRPILPNRSESEGDFLVIFNAQDQGIEFRLPDTSARRWRCLLDTAASDPFAVEGFAEPRSYRRVDARSTVVLHGSESAAQAGHQAR